MTAALSPRSWWWVMVVAFFLSFWRAAHGWSTLPTSLVGMQWSVQSAWKVFELEREADGCLPQHMIEVRRFPGVAEVVDGGLTLTASAAAQVEVRWRAHCPALTPLTFTSIDAWSWGEPWAALSTPSTSFLLGGPEWLGSVSTPVEASAMEMVGEVFLPAPGSVFVFPSFRSVTAVTGQWNGEFGELNTKRVWGSGSIAGQLGWSLVTSTPLPTQVTSARDCVSLAELFFPAQLRPCWVSEQSRALMNQAGRNWVVRNGVVEPVVEIAPQYPAFPGDVVINEVMWMGSLDTSVLRSSDEWLELYNPTDTAWNLAGMKIEKAASLGTSLSFLSKVVLLPHSYLIVGRQRGTSTMLVRDPDIVLTDMRLSNDEAGIVLRSRDGVVIDELPAGAWQAGVNDLEGWVRASAQRRHWQLPGTDWSSWTHCNGDPPERCWLLQTDGWRAKLPANQGTPWHMNVL